MRGLVALALLLLPVPLPAQEASDIEQIGPWRLICYRGDKLYGHAFESCRAYAIFDGVGVFVDRNSKGVIGYLEGKSCPSASTVFRLSAKDVAPNKKNRAANFAKVIDKTFAQCRQPPPGADITSIALMLQRSDGLSAEWVG